MKKRKKKAKRKHLKVVSVSVSNKKHKQSLDVWTNPVHNQMRLASYEEDGEEIQTGLASEGPARSGYVQKKQTFDETISTHDNYAAMYGQPQNRGNNFNDNLVNGVAAENAVMDDIIGHMATPIGGDEDIEDTDEDDTGTGPSNLEMQNLYSKPNQAAEGGRTELRFDVVEDLIANAYKEPQHDLDVDDIDNGVHDTPLAHNEDTEDTDDTNDTDMVMDIDRMVTPIGNEVDDIDDLRNDVQDHGNMDKDVVHEVDDLLHGHKVTVGANEEGLGFEISENHGDADDDIIDDYLENEMQTPNGDDIIVYDDDDEVDDLENNMTIGDVGGYN